MREQAQTTQQMSPHTSLGPSDESNTSCVWPQLVMPNHRATNSSSGSRSKQNPEPHHPDPVYSGHPSPRQSWEDDDPSASAGGSRRKPPVCTRSGKALGQMPSCRPQRATLRAPSMDQIQCNTCSTTQRNCATHGPQQPTTTHPIAANNDQQQRNDHNNESQFCAQRSTTNTQSTRTGPR